MQDGGRRRRVLLMVVDGWTPAVFSGAVARGELPTLACLVGPGSLNTGCVTVFPSIECACQCR